MIIYLVRNMVKCWCEEYWVVEEGIYHNVKGEKMVSLRYKIFCDHMFSVTQVLAEYSLGKTLEEWLELSLEERVKILKSYVPLNIAKELAEKGVFREKIYPCPYCN